MDVTTRPSTARTADCGHAQEAYGRSTGISTDVNGVTRCTPCSNVVEEAALATVEVGERYTAYVGRDGSLTTWTGHRLAGPKRHSEYVNNLGHDVHAWRFRAADGREYYGRNAGRGMVITVTRARNTRLV